MIQIFIAKKHNISIYNSRTLFRLVRSVKDNGFSHTLSSLGSKSFELG